MSVLRENACFQLISAEGIGESFISFFFLLTKWQEYPSYKDASKTGPGCYLWEHSPAWVPAAPGEVPLTCSPATASRKTAKQSLQRGRNLPHSLKNGVRNWIRLHIPSWVSHSNVIAKASRTHFIFLALSKTKQNLIKGSHNLEKLILWWLSRCLQYFFYVVGTIFLPFFLLLSLPLAFK